MSDVAIRVENRAGRITLNRPEALNALTLPMVKAVDAALTAWTNDTAVSQAVIDAAGKRAFCAGGDIRMLYEAARTGDVAAARAFFAAEYAMNARIARFPKPYIAIMDGLVMGGGVGISAHGSVRVATERTVLAMPETGIGLFPDVGATWLLGRAGALGMHLALTGARIDAHQAIRAGLADAVVPSAEVPALIRRLTTANADVRGLADPGSQPVGPTAWMELCYGHDSVEAIVAALAGHPDQDAQSAAREIATKSPSSLKVTLRALREAAAMPGLEQALAQELVLATSCMRSHDFVEGVRAAVIDRDRQPRWQPARLEDVTPSMVDRYFDASLA